jgi:thymidylate synthase
MEEQTRHVIDLDALPKMYPTHRHEPTFWESLGRAVATFGVLEETLAKAIFAFTATKPYSEEEVMKALDEWAPKLMNALSDQLWNLIESYGKAVHEHPEATIKTLDELLEQLKEAAKIRNVICHGSWRSPNSKGASVPFFVNRQQERFDTAIDVAFLLQLQKHVSELICAVVNTVTHMGWQFPGSEGSGKVIWESRK